MNNSKTNPPPPLVRVLAGDADGFQPARRVDYVIRPKGVSAFYDRRARVWWRFMDLSGLRIQPINTRQWKYEQ